MDVRSDAQTELGREDCDVQGCLRVATRYIRCENSGCPHAETTRYLCAECEKLAWEFRCPDCNETPYAGGELSENGISSNHTATKSSNVITMPQSSDSNGQANNVQVDNPSKKLLDLYTKRIQHSLMKASGLSSCNGVTECKHGRHPMFCPACNNMLCPHDQYKSQCNLCNRCIHNESRYDCKICSRCVHGEDKRTCMQCNGCEHHQLRVFCLRCSGCEHQQLKIFCKICGVCDHGLLKLNCPRCHGENENVSMNRGVERLGAVCARCGSKCCSSCLKCQSPSCEGNIEAVCSSKHTFKTFFQFL